MHYAIGTVDGKVHDIECDPRALDDEMERLGGGVLLTQSQKLDLYEKRRAQDITGKADSY